MTAIRSAPRRMSLLTLALTAVGLGVLAGGAAAIAVALGLAPGAIAHAVAVLVAGLAVLIVTGRWWQGADEAVQEAHKSSWFWGGSTGLLVTGAIAVALVEIALGHAPGQFGVTRAEAGLIVAGIALTAALMLIGYGLFWAAWWLRRSR